MPLEIQKSSGREAPVPPCCRPPFSLLIPVRLATTAISLRNLAITQQTNWIDLTQVTLTNLFPRYHEQQTDELVREVEELEDRVESPHKDRFGKKQETWAGKVEY